MTPRAWERCADICMLVMLCGISLGVAAGLCALLLLAAHFPWYRVIEFVRIAAVGYACGIGAGLSFLISCRLMRAAA